MFLIRLKSEIDRKSTTKFQTDQIFLPKNAKKVIIAYVKRVLSVSLADFDDFCHKMHFFVKKICVIQIKAVLLRAFLRSRGLRVKPNGAKSNSIN